MLYYTRYHKENMKSNHRCCQRVVYKLFEWQGQRVRSAHFVNKGTRSFQRTFFLAGRDWFWLQMWFSNKYVTFINIYSFRVLVCGCSWSRRHTLRSTASSRRRRCRRMGTMRWPMHVTKPNKKHAKLKCCCTKSCLCLLYPPCLPHSTTSLTPLVVIKPKLPTTVPRTARAEAAHTKNRSWILLSFSMWLC